MGTALALTQILISLCLQHLAPFPVLSKHLWKKGREGGRKDGREGEGRGAEEQGKEQKKKEESKGKNESKSYLLKPDDYSNQEDPGPFFYLNINFVNDGNYRPRMAKD